MIVNDSVGFIPELAFYILHRCDLKSSSYYRRLNLVQIAVENMNKKKVNFRVDMILSTFFCSSHLNSVMCKYQCTAKSMFSSVQVWSLSLICWQDMSG